MKMQSALQRTLQALFITGISIFALSPALAENLAQVTADNYVRAESDFQMKGYSWEKHHPASLSSHDVRVRSQ